MKRSRKLLLTTLAVGTTGAVAGLGVFAAFTATTENVGNSIASGTVQISDNDGGTTALYTESGGAPGTAVERCIRVTYGGTLASTLKLYRNAGDTITNGDQFTIAVERGTGLTGTFPACTGFAKTGDVYTQRDLDAFPTDYATAADAFGAPITFLTGGRRVDYKFILTVKDDPTPNDHTTPNDSGVHGFTWEARSN